MEEKQQELMYKLSMFEQQIQNIQQQLQAVEKALVDMSSLNVGLNDLKGKKDKEIIAQVGRGIHVKAKLLSEDLIVEVGENNLVKKSIPETQGIIEEQIGKLGEAKQELEKAMNDINEELTKTMRDNYKKE